MSAETKPIKQINIPEATKPIALPKTAEEVIAANRQISNGEEWILPKPKPLRPPHTW